MTSKNSASHNLRLMFLVLALFALITLTISGCNSRRSERTEERDSAQQKQAAQHGSDPGIDLNCVMDHIQNPPEAFHYSYKKDSSNPVEEEADITPQTIDGTRKNSGGDSIALHGVHSDPQSWQGAWSGLMGISGMSSAIALVHSGSAIAREGTEKMNGYDTTRYSIDTARGTGPEQGLYKSTLGNGGFEKGTAWVTEKGCPVKLVIDSELHGNDGSVEKIHYEEAMVKK
ncbi:MAG: hypothetical protein ACXVZV_04870 [Terriglobales bacterium]